MYQLELIAASQGVGIEVMSEICRRVQDGFVMPVEWVIRIVVPIFKGRVILGSAAAMEL